MKRFILAFLLQIYCSYAIDFESFIGILQDLSNGISISNVSDILVRPSSDKDIFDSMMVFAKTALEHDPALSKVLLTKIQDISDPFVKTAIIRALSMQHHYREELDKLNLTHEDRSLKNQAYKINYRFTQIIYPEHLMLCFKATDNPEYIFQIIEYLNFDEENFKQYQIDINSLRSTSDLSPEKREATISYIFFLEAKTTLKTNLSYRNIKEILMNIPENLKTGNVEANVSEIINEPQNNIE